MNVGLISSKKLHLQIMHLEETFGYSFNDTDDKLVIVSLRCNCQAELRRGRPGQASNSASLQTDSL
jgi:hypothetical protein